MSSPLLVLWLGVGCGLADCSTTARDGFGCANVTGCPRDARLVSKVGAIWHVDGTHLIQRVVAVCSVQSVQCTVKMLTFCHPQGATCVQQPKLARKLVAEFVSIPGGCKTVALISSELLRGRQNCKILGAMAVARQRSIARPRFRMPHKSLQKRGTLCARVAVQHLLHRMEDPSLRVL